MTHPCGLHIVVAPTGNGKSMFLMQHLGHVLATTDRTIVTNLPITEEGLVEVMNEEYPAGDWLHRLKRVPSDKDAESDFQWTLAKIRSRIWACKDVGTIRRYWLQRGFGWTLIDLDPDQYEQDQRPDWSVAFRYVEKVHDGKDRIPLYKLRMRAVLALETAGEVERKSMEDLPACEFIIDEAGDYFAKLTGSKLGPGYPFYQRMKRKIGRIGDNTTMACQYAKQIDLELREQANDWMFLINWAARRKGFFNLPRKATWAKYPTLPMKGDSPMLTGFFAINGETWGRTYDTSAGVGIEGGFAADKGQGVGGISWMWIPVIMLAALVLLHFTPRGLAGTVTWLISGNKATPAIPQVATNRPPPVPVPEPVHPLKQAKQVVQDEEVESMGELAGFMVEGGVLHIYWRSGIVTTSGDREFQGALRSRGMYSGVKWNGKTYHLRPFTSGELAHKEN